LRHFQAALDERGLAAVADAAPALRVEQVCRRAAASHAKLSGTLGVTRTRTSVEALMCGRPACSYGVLVMTSAEAQRRQAL
jgi:hypothetical protein